MSQLSWPELNSSNAGTEVVKTSAPSFLPSADGILKGDIEKVIYFDESNGRCLLEVRPENSKINILLEAHAPWVYPGVHFEAQLFEEGVENSNGHFVTESISFSFPTSARMQKKFLRSDAVEGITPHLVRLLSLARPGNLIATFDHDPKALSGIAGIGPKKQESLLEAWSDFKNLISFKEYLFASHLPLAWSSILWPRYGMESFFVIQKTPYKVASQLGLPFQEIDRFALGLGFGRESYERIHGALQSVLYHAYRQGHCAFPEERVLNEATAKLGISRTLVDDVFERDLIEENFVVEPIANIACVYLKEIWQLENEVANELLKFKDRRPSWNWLNSPKFLNWAQSILNIQLAPLQKTAIEMAMTSSLTIITGGPGTGKTTLIRSLVAILQTQFLKFALCSPTGRASKRLEDVTGNPAQTIHRLLKYDGFTDTFLHNRANPLPYDLVLVDEASMIDLELMHHLLEALPSHCSLIVIGDADQIPSVGAGTVLQSLIGSGAFTTVKLTDIYRQSDRSLIKINAKQINSGKMPLLNSGESTDFHYIPVRDASEAKKVVFDLVTNVIPNRYGITDLRQSQVLLPLNGGVLGCVKMNEELQKKFHENEKESIGIGISRMGPRFKAGDKVMVTKNDYHKNIFNGDIGFVRSVNLPEGLMEVGFDDRILQFRLHELESLALAYAISIHKAQGSEYRAVIVVLSQEHHPRAQRHLLYTAVTRGKEHVFLVAEPTALQFAVSSNDDDRRYQKLTERLRVGAEVSVSLTPTSCA